MSLCADCIWYSVVTCVCMCLKVDAVAMCLFVCFLDGKLSDRAQGRRGYQSGGGSDDDYEGNVLPPI